LPLRIDLHFSYELIYKALQSSAHGITAKVKILVARWAVVAVNPPLPSRAPFAPKLAQAI
jgi:hypothetical protein